MPTAFLTLRILQMLFYHKFRLYWFLKSRAIKKWNTELMYQHVYFIYSLTQLLWIRLYFEVFLSMVRKQRRRSLMVKIWGFEVNSFESSLHYLLVCEFRLVTHALWVSASWSVNKDYNITLKIYFISFRLKNFMR